MTAGTTASRSWPWNRERFVVGVKGSNSVTVAERARDFSAPSTWTTCARSVRPLFAPRSFASRHRQRRHPLAARPSEHAGLTPCKIEDGEGSGRGARRKAACDAGISRCNMPLALGRLVGGLVGALAGGKVDKSRGRRGGQADCADCCMARLA